MLAKSFGRALLLLMLTAACGCQSTGPTARRPARPPTPEAVRFGETLGKAQRGEAAAQGELGRLYAEGRGVPRDAEEAVKWYLRAAERGNALAQYQLGLCYQRGTGVDYDAIEAVKWLRQAAEQGNSKAQTRLGVAFLQGQGVAGDFNQAGEWVGKAAAQGDPDAKGVLLGLAYLEAVLTGKDQGEALHGLRASAEQGNAVAQTFLGLWCLQGWGMARDEKQAVQWFRQAAEQDNAVAQETLGLAYLDGRGVKQNYRKALQWSRKAAEQGSALAQLTLGTCYWTGRGVEPNPAEAVKWFRQAAQRGSDDAQAALGIALCQGRGVARDYVEAWKWLNRAAVQGNPVAASAREKLSRRMSAGQLARAGAVPRRHLTKFDRRVIDAHEQRYNLSCIPSAVEMVVKLLGRVPPSYYEQQDAWKNKADGCFRNFESKTIGGVTFHSDFWQPHNADFPLEQLFAAIDRELRAGRFVIVGLACMGGTHDWVIYDEDVSGEFLAVSKAGKRTLENNQVRKTITEMQGTDIGTYELER